MTLLSAIAFDPTIRGLLVVMVAVGVLFGSVYLIVATNTGVRNGFLIAMAALTGWCFLMGAFWTIRGIGMVGSDPSWMVKEINFDRAASTVTDHLDKLPDSDPRDGALPTAEDLFADYSAKHPEIVDQIAKTEGEGWSPESLTELVTLVPQIKKQLDPKLGGWRILSESDSRRGETAAAADAALAENQVFGSTTSTTDYTIHDVFFYGGKSGAEPETIPGEWSLWRKAWHRIETTLEIKNPTLYAAVTLQKNVPSVTAPGEAPPPARVDDSASMITVALQRNLGNKRVIPFLFMVFTGILFAAFTWMLHTRDKRAMAARAAWDPKAG